MVCTTQLDKNQYPRTFSVFGVGICIIGFKECIELISSLSCSEQSASVSFVNAYVLLTSRKNEAEYDALNNSTLNLIDGSSVHWIAKHKGFKTSEKCSGPDIMDSILQAGLSEGKRHFFYGSTKETLDAMLHNLQERYPSIVIAGQVESKFRPLTKEEDEKLIEQINMAAADFIWVGLGTPRSDPWIADHRDKIPGSVMLNIGGMFDVYANNTKRAPKLMRDHGLEWFYRLYQEPRRLWKRYLVGNVQFIWLYMLESIESFLGRPEKKIQDENKTC